MQRSERQRVVITGIGVVSPNGVGAERFGENCAMGVSGIRGIQGVDVSRLKTSAVGQVVGWDPVAVMGLGESRRVPRMVPMALRASREALAQAKIEFASGDVGG